MDFQLTEEQRRYQALVREFAEKEVAPYVREYDREERYPVGIVRRMGALGFLGGTIPEAYGGPGLDHLTMALGIEEMSRVCIHMGSAMGRASGLVGSAILAFGTEAQKQKYLVPLARGEAFGGTAITEPHSGTDVAAMETTAARHGDEYVLNGTKTWISGVGLADWYLTFAALDRGQGSRAITAFIGEPGAPASRSVPSATSWPSDLPLSASWCSRTAGSRWRTGSARKGPGSGWPCALSRTGACRWPAARWGGVTVRTIAMLHEDGLFGTSIANHLERHARAVGMELVLRVGYSFRAPDLTTEVTKVKAARADLVVVTGYYGDGLLIARTATEHRLEARAVMGIANGWFSNPRFLADQPQLADLMMDGNYWHNPRSERTRAVMEAYRKRFGAPMSSHSDQAYAAMMVVRDALERAGKVDRTAVREALARTRLSDHILPQGPIEFDRTGENVNAQPALLQNQGGRTVVVGPPAYAEARAVFPVPRWSRG